MNQPLARLYIGPLIGPLLCAALALAPAAARANDGIGADSAGGIVLGKTDAIAMKKEVLTVSQSAISVDYEFLNESDADKTERVVFPLPAYGASIGEEAYYGEPENFVIQVDGKPVEHRTIVRAFLGDKDVTDQLKRLGLTERQIAWFTAFPDANPFNVKKAGVAKKAVPAKKAAAGSAVHGDTLTASQIQALKSAALVDNQNDSGVDAPTWTVKILYAWTQTFPAGALVRVHHSYRPFVAAGSSYEVLGPELIHDYCMNPDFIARWHKRVRALHSDHLHAAGVSYILKTGNTWKAGIEDFTLILKKNSPDEMVSLCFPGDAEKVDSTTLRIHLTHFKPRQDLDVYFSNLAQYADQYKSVPPRLGR